MKDIGTEYRKYKFFDKVPLISKDKQWKEYIDEKVNGIDITVDNDGIANAISNNVSSKFEGVSQKIDDAKESIVTNVAANSKEVSENIQKARESIEYVINTAKDDINCNICCSKKEIKKHIDNKIDPIKFEEKFSNLNDQVASILSKINKE